MKKEAEKDWKSNGGKQGTFLIYQVLNEHIKMGIGYIWAQRNRLEITDQK
jgi:hypothetical protein